MASSSGPDDVDADFVQCAACNLARRDIGKNIPGPSPAISRCPLRAMPNELHCRNHHDELKSNVAMYKKLEAQLQKKGVLPTSDTTHTYRATKQAIQRYLDSDRATENTCEEIKRALKMRCSTESWLFYHKPRNGLELCCPPALQTPGLKWAEDQDRNQYVPADKGHLAAVSLLQWASKQCDSKVAASCRKRPGEDRCRGDRDRASRSVRARSDGTAGVPGLHGDDDSDDDEQWNDIVIPPPGASFVRPNAFPQRPGAVAEIDVKTQLQMRKLQQANAEVKKAAQKKSATLPEVPAEMADRPGLFRLLEALVIERAGRYAQCTLDNKKGGKKKPAAASPSPIPFLDDTYAIAKLHCPGIWDLLIDGLKGFVDHRGNDVAEQDRGRRTPLRLAVNEIESQAIINCDPELILPQFGQSTESKKLERQRVLLQEHVHRMAEALRDYVDFIGSNRDAAITSALSKVRAVTVLHEIEGGSWLRVMQVIAGDLTEIITGMTVFAIASAYQTILTNEQYGGLAVDDRGMVMMFLMWFKAALVQTPGTRAHLDRPVFGLFEADPKVLQVVENTRTCVLGLMERWANPSSQADLTHMLLSCMLASDYLFNAKPAILGKLAATFCYILARRARTLPKGQLFDAADRGAMNPPRVDQWAIFALLCGQEKAIELEIKTMHILPSRASEARDEDFVAARETMVRAALAKKTDNDLLSQDIVAAFANNIRTIALRDQMRCTAYMYDQEELKRDANAFATTDESKFPELERGECVYMTLFTRNFNALDWVGLASARTALLPGSGSCRCHQENQFGTYLNAVKFKVPFLLSRTPGGRLLALAMFGCGSATVFTNAECPQCKKVFKLPIEAVSITQPPPSRLTYSKFQLGRAAFVVYDQPGRREFEVGLVPKAALYVALGWNMDGKDAAADFVPL